MNSTFNQSDLNGFKLATANVPSVESASLGIFIPVGCRHETANVAGVSHFLEHMIFKGTTTRSASQLAIEAEGNGITMNAYTTEDHTMLEMRGPKENLDLMIELSGDMLWNSKYDIGDIDNERSVIEEEIIGYEESPADHVHDLLSRALWGDHPLAYSITGNEETLANIDQQALLNHHNAHYLSKGICVAAAGNFEHQQVKNAVSEHFPTLSKVAPTASPMREFAPSSIVEHRDIEQSHLCLGFKTEGRQSSERHALRLISLILGETMSSRLFQRLREELGLCYSIHTDFNLFEEIGNFNICAAFDSERLDQAQNELHAILNGLHTSPITQQELDHAKRFAIAQNRINLEGSQPYMQWAGDSTLCYNTIIDPSDAHLNVQAVTLEQLHQVCHKVINTDHMASALITSE